MDGGNIWMEDSERFILNNNLIILFQEECMRKVKRKIVSQAKLNLIFFQVYLRTDQSYTTFSFQAASQYFDKISLWFLAHTRLQIAYTLDTQLRRL